MPVLIQTKLNRPRMPRQAVDRPRLLDLLDATFRYRVTLVSASAGFGKTTLISQWLEQRSFPSSWIGLDRLDSDPERFSRYFVEALRHILPDGLEHTDALLRARTPPPWSFFIETLASELIPPPESSVLVLEDYHALACEDIDALLERTVEVLPETLHLIILTRVDPPWPLGRWRAHGWVNELRSRDLRFSIGETRSFFGLYPDLRLKEETVEALHQKTEGWVAGLKLAELSMEGTEDPESRAQRLSGSDRNIADFLLDDVLSGQPSEIREFLVVAASFDKFCGPLCDHVLADPTGSSRAQQIIALLESQNLFLVPLDEERKWYRFHHMFQEFLVQRKATLVSPELRDRIDARAADWYCKQGMVEDALRHWVAAGDLDSAANLIGQHVDSMVREDLSRRTLSRWLKIFPPDAEQDRLPLLVARGCQRIIYWDLAGLAQLIERAEPLSSAAGGAFRSNLEVLKTFLLYWQGDLEGAVSSARAALADSPPIGGVTWSLATMYSAAGSALLGRHGEALRHLDEAVAQAARENHFAAEFIGVQGILHVYAGEYDAVRGRALQLLAAHERDPVPEYWLGHVYYLLALEAYERNRLREAEDWFQKIAELRYLVTSRLYQDAFVGLALVSRARGDTAGLEAHVAEARAWALEIGDLTSLRIINSLELRLFPREADWDEHDPPPADDHQSFWLEVPSVTWAERLIQDESPEVRIRALPFVDSALERMRQHHNERQLTILLAVRATALSAVGRREEALNNLEAVLRRAAPHGLIRTFVDRGPRLKELLDELSRKQEHDGYREMLRGAFLEEGKSAVKADNSADEPWKIMTYRELEVLELLAERLTDKEIASRLSVTPGAIKKRTRTIYRKLDAGDRREAVALALARGVLKTKP